MGYSMININIKYDNTGNIVNLVNIIYKESIVMKSSDDWITIFCNDESKYYYPSINHNILESITRELNCYGIVICVDDSDTLFYWIAQNGEIVDIFISVDDKYDNNEEIGPINKIFYPYDGNNNILYDISDIKDNGLINKVLSKRYFNNDIKQFEYKYRIGTKYIINSDMTISNEYIAEEMRLWDIIKLLGCDKYETDNGNVIAFQSYYEITRKE